MPPDHRPFPRFIADSSQHGIPTGRFADRLAAEFRNACASIEDLPEGVEPPEEIEWFPERSWNGRVWVPASARGEIPGDEGEPGEQIEFFGFVSFVQPDGDDPTGFGASADFTDVLAEDNPHWRIDLGDEVIGRWNGENGRTADITLVWGRSLVPGGFAATAEIDGTVVDQEPLIGDRFTLVAPDALAGYGDEMYLEVRLWASRGQELAAESLYDEAEPEQEGEGATGEEDGPDGSDGESRTSR